MSNPLFNNAIFKFKTSQNLSIVLYKRVACSLVWHIIKHLHLSSKGISLLPHLYIVFFSAKHQYLCKGNFFFSTPYFMRFFFFQIAKNRKKSEQNREKKLKHRKKNWKKWQNLKNEKQIKKNEKNRKKMQNRKILKKIEKFWKKLKKKWQD